VFNFVPTQIDVFLGLLLLIRLSSSTTFQQLQQKAVHPISINDELVRQIATGSSNNNKSMNSFSQDAHSALQPYWPYLAVKLHHFGLSCEVTR
jgi:hypothetical protein